MDIPSAHHSQPLHNPTFWHKCESYLTKKVTKIAEVFFSGLHLGIVAFLALSTFLVVPTCAMLFVGAGLGHSIALKPIALLCIKMASIIIGGSIFFHAIGVINPEPYRHRR